MTSRGVFICQLSLGLGTCGIQLLQRLETVGYVDQLNFLNQVAGPLLCGLIVLVGGHTFVTASFYSAPVIIGLSLDIADGALSGKTDGLSALGIVFAVVSIVGAFCISML